MRLKKLVLTNFKGVKSFALDTQGGNVAVYGTNASGKSTLFDAFLWTLFGRDSQGKVDFEIKTLDPSGNVIHGLDHSVELVLEVDGQEITLKRVYHELWQKKRGSANKVMTGHSTDFWIQGIPCKKGEYEARVSGIIDQNVFQLLTDPAAFNNLHWTKRRDLLLSICGDISDAEVIASDDSLSKLPDILQGRKLEDHRKVIASKRTEINKELTALPIRIDECQRGLPDISGINQEEATQTVSTLKASVKQLQQQIVSIDNGGEIAEKTKALREVEGQLLEIKNQFAGANNAKGQELQRQLTEANGNCWRLSGEIKAMERTLEQNNQTIQDLKTQMEGLRQSWHEVSSRQFHFEQSDNCPYCDQPLPAEKLAEARAKALAEFNRGKATQLESITAEGKRLKTQADELAAKNTKIGLQLQGTRAELEVEGKVVEDLQKQIEALRVDAVAYLSDPVYLEKRQEKHDIEASIAAIKDGQSGEADALRAQIADLETQIRVAESQLSDVARYKQGQVRITELKAQERKLAAEYEQLESELYLTDLFVKTKVGLLEEKINSRFKMARFKLFNVLVNGGVEECCEVTVDGVPYGTGLNNAARICVGLDIIETLSEHFGFSPVIFIDNAEAITQLPEMKAQLIALYVSEADKTLRVETAPAEGQQTLFKEAM